jgi:uncharacterized protein (DUF1800 family)
MRVGVARWSQAHVRRLYWRAGFGATTHEAAHWARQGKHATLRHLLDTGGRARLVGKPPRVKGQPLDPENEWGHAALWWLDRMVRSSQPLEEKLTLFWHDHFATGGEDEPLMLAQNRVLRAHALGSFPQLLAGVTRGTAMQLFLSLADSDKTSPNENFARELMELFTLGGGYSEHDVREAARALTGFVSHWPDSGLPSVTYDPKRHDRGVKTIFGHRGHFDWRDVLRLCVAHPRHPPFLVDKLWAFFVNRPLDRTTRRSLVRAYTGSGHRVEPVVARILAHPALYRSLGEPDMVKSPVVYVAGALRMTGDHVRRDDWAWLLSSMGQMPFDPPSVAGWDWGEAWLSSNSVKIRHAAVNYLSDRGRLHVPDGGTPTKLSSKQAVARAWTATGRPWLSPATKAAAHRLAHHMLTGTDKGHGWMDLQQRADQTQRVLRQLFIAGPDGQVH